jgi:hypothetical protein
MAFPHSGLFLRQKGPKSDPSHEQESNGMFLTYQLISLPFKSMITTFLSSIPQFQHVDLLFQLSAMPLADTKELKIMISKCLSKLSFFTTHSMALLFASQRCL